MTGQKILDIKMQENDAEAKTIRDYLKTLLMKLWEDGESFSGKRPFGNSGWDGELEMALVEAGVMREGDTDTATGLITKAISALR